MWRMIVAFLSYYLRLYPSLFVSVVQKACCQIFWTFHFFYNFFMPMFLNFGAISLMLLSSHIGLMVWTFLQLLLFTSIGIWNRVFDNYYCIIWKQVAHFSCVLFKSNMLINLFSLHNTNYALLRGMFHCLTPKAVIPSYPLDHYTHTLVFKKHYGLIYVARYGIIRIRQLYDMFDVFALFGPILTMLNVLIIWLHSVTT